MLRPFSLFYFRSFLSSIVFSSGFPFVFISTPIYMSLFPFISFVNFQQLRGQLGSLIGVYGGLRAMEDNHQKRKTEREKNRFGSGF